MQNTYRLALNKPFSIEPFGPLMNLDKATLYQADMTLAGCNVVIVNTKTGESA